MECGTTPGFKFISKSETILISYTATEPLTNVETFNITYKVLEGEEFIFL